jgi:hypothetical protein
MCAIMSPSYKVRDFEIKDCSTRVFSVAMQYPDESKNQVLNVFGANSVVPSTRIVSLCLQSNVSAVSLCEGTMLSTYSISGLPDLDSHVQVKVRLRPDHKFHVESATLITKELVPEEQ